MEFKYSKSLVSAAILSVIVASPAALAKADKKEEKTVASMIKDKAHQEGFIDLYQDEKTGSLMALISEDQLNKPFLHFSHTVNGAMDAGHFKGGFRLSDKIEFRKQYNKIEVVKRPNRYKFDPESPLAKTADTNMSIAIIASLPIEAADDKKKQYLVNMDALLLSVAIDPVVPFINPADPNAKKRFKLGKLSKNKTKYTKINNYPENTDVVVEYTFDNPSPTVFGGRELADPRYVSLQLQHSFIKLPENDFKARRADPRVGYFGQEFDILTSTEWANYGDVINRWNLVKKDPSAALSEPVEPITWWIENTTPLEWRDEIKKAVLSWNEAFETAGFKNAVEVKIQPDDAEWDAGDIRYNVLRWTSSPRPPFGGYGPSVAHPDTGQIIASDIMLEYVFMKNRWFLEDVFQPSGASQTGNQYGNQLVCSAGHALQHSLAFGTTVAAANGLPDMEKSEMLRQGLHYLILHEVGHTLGLNHNMKATQLLSPQEAHDKSKTQGIIAGSVMDYPQINLAPPGQKQGDFISYRPGPYDHWAIEYGYSQGLEEPSAEEARLEKILSRSTEPQLAFGNDADDMRAPGRHLDPRVNIYDMSNDAIGFAQGQFELVKATLPKVKDRVLEEGDSYHDLKHAVEGLIRTYRSQSNVTTRYIGGVYVDRSMVGQKGADKPFEAVPLALQKRAMDSLAKYVFTPNVLEDAHELVAYMQSERRGFNHFGRNEDPKFYDHVLNMHKQALDHLLHKEVLKRMTNSAVYGNEYSIEQYMQDLTAAIFDEDLRGEVNSKRRNLQVEYIARLVKAMDPKSGYDYISVATIHHQLSTLAKKLKYSNTRGATKIHQQYLAATINKALD